MTKHMAREGTFRCKGKGGLGQTPQATSLIRQTEENKNKNMLGDQLREGKRGKGEGGSPQKQRPNQLGGTIHTVKGRGRVDSVTDFLRRTGGGGWGAQFLAPKKHHNLKRSLGPRGKLADVDTGD